MTHLDGVDFLASILSDDTTPVTDITPTTRLKLSTSRTVLKTLLDKASTVVPHGDVMPVLTCVQLDAAAQRLRVIGSDIQLSMITSTHDVAVHHDGVAVFPARKLLDIVKSADGDDVTLTVTGSTGHVRIGRASWTLRLHGGDDYPPMPAITEAAFTAVDRTVFLSALQTVRPAASRDTQAYNLNIIDITDGRITASDGNRIQQVTITDFPLSLRIPISAVDHLLRLLKLSDAPTIHVGQSDNRVIVRCGPDILIINKTVAAFTDMQALLLRPALHNQHRLWAPRAALLAAIRRVRINADTDTAAIALHLDTNTVTVQARDRHGNTAEEAITAEWAGPPRTVVVNHHHFADLLHTHTAADAVMHLGDDTRTRRSPLLLRHSDTVGVLQQMNTDWGQP